MSKKKKPAARPPTAKNNPPSQPAAPPIETTSRPTGDRSLTETSTSKPPSNLARNISFGLLLLVIGLVGFVFFEVMLSFLIPLFLAAILVVVFRPLHRWFLEQCGGRQRLSALLTTVAVLLTVLVPIALLLLMAVVEGREAVHQFNVARVEEGIRAIRSNLKLEMPAAQQIRDIESRLIELQQTEALDDMAIDQHRSSLYEIQEAAQSLGDELQRAWPEATSFVSPLESDASTRPTPASSHEDSDPDTETGAAEPAQAVQDTDLQNESDPNDHWQQFCLNLQWTRKLHYDVTLTRAPNENEEISRQRLEQVRHYRNLINETAQQFSQFKSQLLGGKTRAWLAELVNPTDQEFETYTSTSIKYLRDKLFKIGGGAASFVGNTLLGFTIMIIGLYFFLLDGPGMIATFQGLSPLDDQHEQELVAEFAKVSRAVVVATLLSALVQGLLAGIGFYFAGLDSIFLLTALSAVLAMVPFVGAAAVWVPCCLYLYFFDNNLTAAIGLAIYGAAIISMADNVIKPYVLHGQSNLHPLLALLSVLGGLATLGPIGILVGPMIVAFLQTLLKMLQREIATIESAP